VSSSLHSDVGHRESESQTDDWRGNSEELNLDGSSARVDGSQNCSGEDGKTLDCDIVANIKPSASEGDWGSQSSPDQLCLNLFLVFLNGRLICKEAIS